MALGPGKYDDLCTYVRDQAGVTDETGGAVLVLVIGGSRGDGLSFQGDIVLTLTLPELLEGIARDVREHGIIGG